MKRSDSDNLKFRAKAPSGNLDLYKKQVAEPVMAAVDAMPPIWRSLVQEFGYVDVYRARMLGISPDAMRQCAKEFGGVFPL